MRVLFLSVEVEPFAKVGGLADVAGSLPVALQGLGHELRVGLPAYGMVVRDPRFGAVKVLEQFPVELTPSTIVLADLYQIEWEGVLYWLIDGDGFFGAITRSEEVYTPSRDAYLFFSLAILEACRILDWVPDVVHANDWHTAFAPVFLRERTDWEETASLYTIHNLAYQGEFGADTVQAAGLPARTFNWKQLETWGGVNFLKSGCAYADQVNTVSPTYAREIQTEELGCRLHGLMSYLAQQGRLSGILNGIDTHHHDPSSDPRIPFHFGPDDMTGKAQCREALLKELGLQPRKGQPVLSLISRLSEQKGFDLVLSKAESFLATGACLVILAIGDKGLASKFRELEERHTGMFRFIEAYEAELAQRLYAGTDIFLMPSAFEPCGLGQMFAMRYGTVPVVRRTGGLADSVHEGVNGFVFEHRDAEEFGATVGRALTAYQDRTRWQGLVRAGMAADWGWARSAKLYETLYRAAVESRRMPAASLAPGR